MISVIIPTFNEKDTIGITLSQLDKSALSHEYEVIVVDASEDDRTINTIFETKAKIIKSKKGRAKQMNLGSKLAKGGILLFLHADTKLPFGWDKSVADCIRNGYDAGGFLKKFDSSQLLLRLNAFYTNMRLKYFYQLLGDNAIFVKKSVFKRINGYKDVSIMEDVDFAKRLKKYKVKVLNDKVITSSRRFEKYGILKTLLAMQFIRILYALGIEERKLKSLL